MIWRVAGPSRAGPATRRVSSSAHRAIHAADCSRARRRRVLEAAPRQIPQGRRPRWVDRANQGLAGREERCLRTWPATTTRGRRKWLGKRPVHTMDGRAPVPEPMGGALRHLRGRARWAPADGPWPGSVHTMDSGTCPRSPPRGPTVRGGAVSILWTVVAGGRRHPQAALTPPRRPRDLIARLPAGTHDAPEKRPALAGPTLMTWLATSLTAAVSGTCG